MSHKSKHKKRVQRKSKSDDLNYRSSYKNPPKSFRETFPNHKIFVGQFISCLWCKNGHLLWAFSNVHLGEHRSFGGARGRKIIFYYITKPHLVNFGRFLPRTSENIHSQVYSKACLCWAHFDLCTHILGAAGGMESEGRNCGPKYGYLNRSSPSKDLLSTKLRSGCSRLVLVRNDQNLQNWAWFYSKRQVSATGSPK